MAFKLNITRATQTEGSTKSEIDWEAYNAHIVNAAGTATKARSIPGVISGIYDLGEQNRPDYEEPFTGDEAAEAAAIEKDSAIYFKSEGKNRIKCRPQKPVQQVAVAIDFPQIIVDKGQFFGESNPLPLRLLLNGEFYEDGQRVVGKPYSITEKKYDDGKWAFAKNNTLHKLAEATGLLDENGYFTKDRIGELVGQIALFQFRVWMKPSNKDKSKLYFTEDIKLAGMVPEGVPTPDFDESILHGTNLNGDNDETAVRHLRLAVKNTIKRANNYQGSDIQKILESDKPQSGPVGNAQEPKATPSPVKAQGGKPKRVVEKEKVLEEDDLPF